LKLYFKKLPHMAFLALKRIKTVFGCGAPSRIPLGELTTLTRLPRLPPHRLIMPFPSTHLASQSAAYSASLLDPHFVNPGFRRWRCTCNRVIINSKVNGHVLCSTVYTLQKCCRSPISLSNMNALWRITSTAHVNLIQRLRRATLTFRPATTSLGHSKVTDPSTTKQWRHRCINWRHCLSGRTRPRPQQHPHAVKLLL